MIAGLGVHVLHGAPILFTHVSSNGNEQSFSCWAQKHHVGGVGGRAVDGWHLESETDQNCIARSGGCCEAAAARPAEQAHLLHQHEQGVQQVPLRLHLCCGEQDCG